MKCPYCNRKINAGKLLGSIKSKKKAASSKRNGKLGGRPSKSLLEDLARKVANK